MLLAYVGLLVFAADLPVGSAPPPVATPHFPDRVHAFVLRNWQLVPAADMARVLGTTPENVLNTGKAMGLSDPPAITDDQRQRSYITVIRRNWHLLPYDQLLDLLGWNAEELAFTLREDDFLWIKLGSLKPACEPLKWAEPDNAARAKQAAIAAIVKESFPNGAGGIQEPLFGFINELSKPATVEPGDFERAKTSPRYCFSYFALYGDAFADGAPDPFPDGYLARLAQSGVNAVWLQAVLYKLAPFAWDPSLSEGYEMRLKNLNALVERVKSHGMGVYLYLNEPRAMPLAFFEKNPDLKGVVEGDHATLCTSNPAVQQYIASAVAKISEEVPNLAGFFTITASENLTNCWSHGQGAQCPRCKQRSAANVIAEMNALVAAGIEMAAGGQKVIAWDWGWGDDWAVDTVNRLRSNTALMSVSEWSIPINRGGVDSIVGEYSLSTIGPGPRAKAHWAAAKKRPQALRTVAKIQANNSWECSAVPYIPAVENVAKHVANIRAENVNGIMFGWTLGGYPSPNLEVAGKLVGDATLTVDAVLASVAERRYGPESAAAVVAAWKTCSAGFSEFPYHIGGIYSGPQQMGPANPLWSDPTGYAATMVGFPYDGLDAWRAVYPPDVYVGQMRKVADGFNAGAIQLQTALASVAPEFKAALESEAGVMEACALHFRSVANQARFVYLRNQLAAATAGLNAKSTANELADILKNEIELAQRMHALQSRDSRFGYEASNHYFYVPIDFVEKVINCRDLLDRWMPQIAK